MLTRSERMVIAFLVVIALAGVSYSAYKKARSPELPGLYYEDTRRLDEKIDINSATEQRLALLNGIGPVTASRIVEYRSEHGPFTAIDEILNVKGIGPKKFEAIKGFITTGEGR